jgi:glycosyltransferase involved in cell wall biosynthesis
MKILVCHNFYQQAGGEDRVFADECRLFENRGHEVLRYTRHNDELRAATTINAATTAVWSRQTYAELSEVIRRHRPQVVHFHNTFPLISPAGYYAARAAGVPVVQTLHNYRLVCPNAMLFRSGRVCEDCLGRSVAWPGVLHRCYRGSRGASATVATMLALHRAAGTWRNQVDVYIALTEFSRAKFLAGGLPDTKFVVKPHFLLEDPGPGRGQGGYALYVGRLSPEKGIRTLLTTWRTQPGLPPLRVVGDGPLAGEVRQAASEGILEWLGWVSRPEARALMAEAACLVFPSEWYETFGLVVIEALAAGTPVVLSEGGAAAELVNHGRTGAHFRSGDAAALAHEVRALVADAGRLEGLRSAARAEYETRYSAEANYQALLDIYRRATRAAGGGRPSEDPDALRTPIATTGQDEPLLATPPVGTFRRASDLPECTPGESDQR